MQRARHKCLHEAVNTLMKDRHTALFQLKALLFSSSVRSDSKVCRLKTNRTEFQGRRLGILKATTLSSTLNSWNQESEAESSLLWAFRDTSIGTVAYHLNLPPGRSVARLSSEAYRYQCKE